MDNKLILIGGGGHCKSVIDIAENAGWNIVGILDTPDKVGSKVLDYEVIGTDAEISQWVNKVKFLITVGQIKDSALRIKLHNEVKFHKGQLAIVISPTAYVSRYAQISEGSVIMHNVVVNADAIIGIGCIINTFANIEHDTFVDDFTHISTGAMVNGNCHVGKRVFLGSQSVIANGISIVDDCIIAAGSMVRKNIVKSGIYADNPATFKKKL